MPRKRAVDNRIPFGFGSASDCARPRLSPQTAGSRPVLEPQPLRVLQRRDPVVVRDGRSAPASSKIDTISWCSLAPSPRTTASSSAVHPRSSHGRRRCRSPPPCARTPRGARSLAGITETPPYRFTSARSGRAGSSASSIGTLPVTPVTSHGVSCWSSSASGSAPMATDTVPPRRGPRSRRAQRRSPGRSRASMPAHRRAEPAPRHPRHRWRPPPAAPHRDRTKGGLPRSSGQHAFQYGVAPLPCHLHRVSPSVAEGATSSTPPATSTRTVATSAARPRTTPPRAAPGSRSGSRGPFDTGTQQPPPPPGGSPRSAARIRPVPFHESLASTSAPGREGELEQLEEALARRHEVQPTAVSRRCASTSAPSDTSPRAAATSSAPPRHAGGVQHRLDDSVQPARSIAPPARMPSRAGHAATGVSWSEDSEAEAAELLGVALPVLGDLDVQVEVDPRRRAAPRSPCARVGADLAQPGAALADDDRLLRRRARRTG